MGLNKMVFDAPSFHYSKRIIEIILKGIVRPSEQNNLMTDVKLSQGPFPQK